MSFKSKKGNAVTIMAVVILSFLMAVSTAYLSMLSTEFQIQGMIDHSDRALDAAFAGSQYALAILSEHDQMFLDGEDRVRFTKGVGADIIESEWLYYDIDPFVDAALLDFVDPYNEMVATAAYRFLISSYVDPNGDEWLYYIKSKGQYRTFDHGTTNANATYTAQILAKIDIDPNRRLMRLRSWRRMPAEDSENINDDFFDEEQTFSDL